MVQNNGTEVPVIKIRSDTQFAEIISDALVSELGSTARSAKTIMRWANVSDRTARNWISAEKAPSGRHLIHLAKNSEAVWASVLAMTGRIDANLAYDVHAVEVALSKALGDIERIKRQTSYRHRTLQI